MSDEQRGMSSMTGAAIAMHEWFLSLRKAGFSESQALKLIAATMKNQSDDDED
jgi:hypothetical protein